MKKRIIFIIPAYNEEANILNTCNKIVEYNKKNKTNYDFIVINDGSKDRTQNILEFHNLLHINLIHNLGIGGAVQTGYKYAYENNYDIAIQFDGDGQHNIKYAKTIIAPIEENECNLVIGSRYISNLSKFKSSTMRQVGIGIISIFIKIVSGKKIYDTTSGFRACDRKTMAYFAKEYPFEYPEPISTLKLLKKKYKVVEVPVEMKERLKGISSIRTWKTIYYMVNVIFSILAIGIGAEKKWI